MQRGEAAHGVREREPHGPAERKIAALLDGAGARDTRHSEIAIDFAARAERAQQFGVRIVLRLRADRCAAGVGDQHREFRVDLLVAPCAPGLVATVDGDGREHDCGEQDERVRHAPTPSPTRAAVDSDPRRHRNPANGADHAWREQRHVGKQHQHGRQRRDPQRRCKHCAIDLHSHHAAHARSAKDEHADDECQWSDTAGECRIHVGRKALGIFNRASA